MYFATITPIKKRKKEDHIGIDLLSCHEFRLTLDVPYFVGLLLEVLLLGHGRSPVDSRIEAMK